MEVHDLKARVAIETNQYVIVLTDEKLEIDLKEGPKAFLEYMVEEHTSLKKILGWAVQHLFPRDLYVNDIQRAYISPEGEVIVEEKTPEGVKTVKVPELTGEQGRVLVETINRLIEEKKSQS